MPTVNLSTSLKTNTQIPLNAKSYFKTLAEMQDLGVENNKAFTYQDSLLAVCVETKKAYTWRENTNNEIGVLENDFEYPENSLANGIDYSGKKYNFFVFNNEATYPKPNEILSGFVDWVQGLEFVHTDLYYRFNNQIYFIESQNFTLDDADPLLNRIDVVAVNNEGELVIVKGLPNENEQEPTIDFNTQLRVTLINVNAGETAPGNVSEEVIYNENLGEPNEWNETTLSPLNNIDFNGIDSPFTGVKHIDGNNIQSSNEIQFEKDSNAELQGLTSFSFRINSLGEKNRIIYVKLLKNGEGIHSFNIVPGTLGLSVISSQEYELVTVPKNIFNPNDLEFNGVVLSFQLNSNEIINRVYIDKIRLVYGLELPSISNTFISLLDTPNSYSNYGAYDVVVKENELGLEFVKRRTKLSEFSNDVGFMTFGDITVDAAMSSTSTNPVQNKVAKAYADTKWSKEVIEVDRYENIPLEAGYYAFLIYDAEAPIYWEIDLKTNSFYYTTNQRLNILSFVNSAQSPFLIIKRELLTSISDLANENELVTYFLDTFYDSQGNLIGTSRPQDVEPILKLELDYFKNRNIKDTYLENNNKSYIGIITDTISKKNYADGVFELYYEFPEYIKINNVEVYFNNKKISDFKVGLIESETENKLGILDYSGSFENYISENQLTIILDYFETTSDKSTKRITPFLNNTLANVVDLETNIPHSNAMVLTFNEVYGGFTNTIFDANSPNITDFYGDSYKTEIAENNIDLMFSAEGSGMSFLKNNVIKNSYGVVPIGSNILTRIDLTDAIDKFPPNYISVTSRSETDNDGTDPLGTSYGFGVEFNEPTLSADLTAQGITGWPGDNEHQQSPATAIVAGKMKYIKDQTGASWDIIREACRQTASNSNNYNIYRGFGVIDTDAAIALIPTLENSRSLELAEYYKATTVMPLALKYEDKSLNTLINKRDLENNFTKKSLNIEKKIVTDIFNTSNTTNGFLVYQVKNNLVSIVCEFDGLSSGVLECLVLPEEIRPFRKRYSAIYNSSNINSYKLEINTNGSIVGQFNSGRTMYFDFTYELDI